MSEIEEYTFTASTIEEAISTGLEELGLNRTEVEIEVLEEGSKGIFGLGARLATVRMVKSTGSVPSSESVSAVPPSEIQEAAAPDETLSTPPPQVTTGDSDLVDISRETVRELLEKMGVRANVAVSMMPQEEDEPNQRPVVKIDITGNDMSILIGRKAETLNALQYVTRLIVGKELGRSVMINVDVQGYRKRKEDSLRRLAQTVARQAVETGRRQYLEPMTPAERRIIHIELRDHPDVYTESIGEGSRRKVTISPKA
jgi:spoIIIJ-associated protein